MGVTFGPEEVTQIGHVVGEAAAQRMGVCTCTKEDGSESWVWSSLFTLIRLWAPSQSQEEWKLGEKQGVLGNGV